MPPFTQLQQGQTLNYTNNVEYPRNQANNRPAHQLQQQPMNNTAPYPTRTLHYKFHSVGQLCPQSIPTQPPTPITILTTTHTTPNLFRPYALNDAAAPKRKISELQAEPSSNEPIDFYSAQRAQKRAIASQAYLADSRTLPKPMAQRIASAPSPIFMPPAALISPLMRVPPAPSYMPSPAYITPPTSKAPATLMPPPTSMPPPRSMPHVTMSTQNQMPPPRVVPSACMPPSTASLPMSGAMPPPWMVPPAHTSRTPAAAAVAPLPWQTTPTYIPHYEGFVTLAPELNLPLFTKQLQNQHVVIQIGRLMHINSNPDTWPAQWRQMLFNILKN